MDNIYIGRIVTTHGVRGEVKVIPLTDDINRYDELLWVFIEKGNSLIKYDIKGVKYFKNFVIINFKGIDNIDMAMELKNCYLLVDRAHAKKLEDDEYFICDLIGCEVFENNISLGSLIEVIETGSNDVYVVRKEDRKQDILIPALKTVVKNVNINDKRIDVILPEGLLD